MPASRLKQSEGDRRELTTRKSPIGSTSNQWGMNPLIEVSLYSLTIS